MPHATRRGSAVAPFVCAIDQQQRRRRRRRLNAQAQALSPLLMQARADDADIADGTYGDGVDIGDEDEEDAADDEGTGEEGGAEGSAASAISIAPQFDQRRPNARRSTALLPCLSSGAERGRALSNQHCILQAVRPHVQFAQAAFRHHYRHLEATI